MVAAEIENTDFDIGGIMKIVRSESSSHDAVVVEGAGGLLVPIDKDYSMADFASDLKFKTVIAARAGLGTINHTLLTVEAAQARSLDIAGIVAYRTALAVLLLLSDGILCIGKHHTNRQVSHLVHWIIPTFHWFLTSSVDFSVGPSLNGSRVFCYSLYV